MLFNTVQFFLFFVVVLALFYTLPRASRKYLLLAASYFFYMSWNSVFVLLLLTLTATDYVCALMMERFETGPKKKLFLILSLAINLAFLGFFKYYNFLAAIVAQIAGVSLDTWR